MESIVDKVFENFHPVHLSIDVQDYLNTFEITYSNET